MLVFIIAVAFYRAEPFFWDSVRGHLIHFLFSLGYWHRLDIRRWQ